MLSKHLAQTRRVLDAMSETTDKLQNLLELVIHRLDGSQKTADERHQAQLSYNEQVFIELKHLSKQIDLTQADVDATLKTVEGSTSPSGAVTTVIH